jgi:hypothetical protein
MGKNRKSAEGKKLPRSCSGQGVPDIPSRRMADDYARTREKPEITTNPEGSCIPGVPREELRDPRKSKSLSLSHTPRPQIPGCDCRVEL